MNQQSMDTHIKVLGWLTIANGALTLLIGGFIFMILAGIGAASGEPDAFGILAVIGLTTGIFMFALSVPSLLAGAGLLWGKSWGRILTIIVSFFNLFSFPIGTALGIYGLYVLLRQEADEYFMMPKAAY
jgi:hypothetical protein